MDTRLQPFSVQTVPEPCASKILTTDASLTGWDAHLDGMEVHSLWPEGVSLTYLVLELKALLLSLRSFFLHLQGHSVAIMSDNTTTISYINQQRGTVSQSLCKLAMDLWDFCLMNDIHPSATHVPGVDNSLEDVLSRQVTSCHEWELNDKYLHPILSAWGFPDLDAFTTQWNVKCSHFCSRGHDVTRGWTPPGLVGSICVCLSTSSKSPTGDTEAFSSVYSSNSGGPVVAQTTMVFDSSQTLGCYLSQYAKGVGSPTPDNCERCADLTSQHPIPRSYPLENFSLEISDWVCNTLLDSRKPSTTINGCIS